ncbi:hypothetical protein GCM10022403_057730 [Streptomyces coacervatus]|uniref:Lipoprotein n=1 Tax=Streptomyces coacervatus TaxID=647381 RepID=A0ABP7IES3_9ACTN|nr:hypothetical protein [Streptomyces coacervatus]MDF2273214.1 hypothetical protein [Streptomyces coacervatus]
MRLKIAAASLALLAGLTAGCTHAGGTTSQKAPATPSGYPEMQKKVAAAESAVTRADQDAQR